MKKQAKSKQLASKKKALGLDEFHGGSEENKPQKSCKHHL